MKPLQPIQKKILVELVNRGGDITVDELRQLYERKGDGYRTSSLIRWGLADWIRPAHNSCGAAIGIRVTETGRTILTEQGGHSR